jgi:hypothetical protein
LRPRWLQLKLFVGLSGHLLCGTPNLREHDPSKYTADLPRSRDASPTPPILLSAAVREPSVLWAPLAPLPSLAPLRPSTLNALGFLDHALGEMKRSSAVIPTSVPVMVWQASNSAGQILRLRSGGIRRYSDRMAAASLALASKPDRRRANRCRTPKSKNLDHFGTYRFTKRRMASSHTPFRG